MTEILSTGLSSSGHVHPLIGIVIVNFNAYSDTADCLRTLRAITYAPVKIVVIHNGCHDGSPARLMSEFTEVHHIVSPKNLGFSGGNNLGIVWALEQHAEHILLLNNDTFVTPDFLEPLVSRLNSDAKIAAVSGKIYYAPEAWHGKSNVIWYAGSFQKWHTGFHHYGVMEEDSGKFDTARPVAYASGCMILMRGEIVRSLGGLSDDYFLYWEEADWCWRAAEHGYVSYYEPRSVIFHNFKSAQQGNETPFYMYMQARNAFVFARRHYKGMLKLRFILFYPIYLFYRLLFEIESRNFRSGRAMLWGILDALRGNTGTKGLKKRGFPAGD